MEVLQVRRKASLARSVAWASRNDRIEWHVPFGQLHQSMPTFVGTQFWSNDVTSGPHRSHYAVERGSSMVSGSTVAAFRVDVTAAHVGVQRGRLGGLLRAVRRRSPGEHGLP